MKINLFFILMFLSTSGYAFNSTGTFINPGTLQGACPDTKLLYVFQDGSGTNIDDKSGERHHGTIENGGVWVTDSYYYYGVACDGSNDDIAVPATGSHILTNNFTFVIGFKFNDLRVGDRQTIIHIRKNTDWQLRRLRNTESGKFRFFIFDAGGEHYILSDVTAIDTDMYYWIIGTKSSTTGLKMWVNGILQSNEDATATDACKTTTNRNNELMRDPNNFGTGEYICEGDIFYFRIISGVWNQGEVDQFMQNKTVVQ